MKDRIKYLRKDVLGMTMEEFGEKVGLSKAAISQIESGKSGLSDVAVKAICNEYNINEAWLRTGEGEMKAEPPEDEIDAVIKKYDLSEEVRVMLEQFVKLRSDHQEIIADYIESVAASLRGDTPAASATPTQKPAARSASSQKPAARTVPFNRSEIPTGSSVPDHLKLTEEEKRLHADLQRDIDTRKATGSKVSSGSASTGK